MCLPTSCVCVFFFFFFKGVPHGSPRLCCNRHDPRLGNSVFLFPLAGLRTLLTFFFSPGRETNPRDVYSSPPSFPFTRLEDARPIVFLFFRFVGSLGELFFWCLGANHIPGRVLFAQDYSSYFSVLAVPPLQHLDLGFFLGSSWALSFSTETPFASLPRTPP